jgi:hypothetical protein
MENEIENGEIEKVKRYLQWATVLVIVAAVVMLIDMQIKQGILRAIKEATSVGTAPIPTSSISDPVVQSDKHMVRATGNPANGSQDGSSRFASPSATEDGEADGTSSDVIRIDGGSEDG